MIQRENESGEVGKKKGGEASKRGVGERQIETNTERDRETEGAREREGEREREKGRYIYVYTFYTSCSGGSAAVCISHSEHNTCGRG